jgi:creatinine amidohydrolase
MLHVEPQWVRRNRAVAGETESIATLLPRLRAAGVRAVSPTGVLGDPAGATSEEGARLLGAFTDRLLAAAAGWRVADDGHLLGDVMRASAKPVPGDR